MSMLLSSTKKRIKLADKKLEKEYLKEIQGYDVARPYYWAMHFVAAAVIFGYVDRHPHDPVGLNAFIKKFYEYHFNAISKMPVRPENSAKNWYDKDVENLFNFSIYSDDFYSFEIWPHISYDYWIKYDPSVVFYDLTRACGSLTYSYLVVRANGGKYEFITSSGNKRIYSKKDYKKFLKEMRECTCTWKPLYTEKMTDGWDTDVDCVDINLHTCMHNSFPRNTRAYSSILNKYF